MCVCLLVVCVSVCLLCARARALVRVRGLVIWVCGRCGRGRQQGGTVEMLDKLVAGLLRCMGESSKKVPGTKPVCTPV